MTKKNDLCPRKWVYWGSDARYRKCKLCDTITYAYDDPKPAIVLPSGTQVDLAVGYLWNLANVDAAQVAYRRQQQEHQKQQTRRSSRKKARA